MTYARAALIALGLLVLTGIAAAEDDKKPDANKEAIPDEGEARAEWIQDRLTDVREGKQSKRRAALKMLVAQDQDGDTTSRLVALLSDGGLRGEALVDLVRALGIDSLVAAIPPLVALLASDDASVRGNVAVSLEYIGGHEAVEPLKKRLGRESIGSVRNHLCRALARCGAGQKPVRAALLKQLRRARADQDLVGPLAGLAYFERDAQVARKLEKLLAKSVVPKGTDGAISARRRAKLMGWTLAHVKDAKTPKFLRDKVLPRLKSSSSISIVGIGGTEAQFYEAVARYIDGDPSAKDTVDSAIGSGNNTGMVIGGRSLGSVSGIGIRMMDDMRKGRDMQDFVPLGDRKPPEAPPALERLK